MLRFQIYADNLEREIEVARRLEKEENEAMQAAQAATELFKANIHDSNRRYYKGIADGKQQTLESIRRLLEA